MRKLLLSTALLWAAALFGNAAQAAIIVTTGNNPQPGDFNVISANCTGNITGPATTIQGCLNS